MFEKEAEEYLIRNLCKTCLTICENNCPHAESEKRAFKDGAEFGYNKANEWHYPSKGECPELNKTCIAKYGKNIVVIEFVNECQFEMIEYWKYCDLPKEIE